MYENPSAKSAMGVPTGEITLLSVYNCNWTKEKRTPIIRMVFLAFGNHILIIM